MLEESLKLKQRPGGSLLSGESLGKKERGSADCLFHLASNVLISISLLFPSWRDHKRSSWLGTSLGFFTNSVKSRRNWTKCDFPQINFVLFLKGSLSHPPSYLGSQNLWSQGSSSHLQIMDLITSGKSLG